MTGQGSDCSALHFIYLFIFLKTNVILLKFTNSQVVSTTSYSEALKKKKKTTKHKHIFWSIPHH